MKITDLELYNGAKEKIGRLGAATLFLEVLELLLTTKVFLLEQKEANGAAYIRQKLDERFANADGWIKQQTGGIDWKKQIKFNATIAVSIGVEIQVSARSDLLIRDIVHLRNSIQQGHIDVGLIVVPSEYLQRFLPDRTPSLKDAIRYIEEEFTEAMSYPIGIISVEHDGTGDVLPKQKRKR